MSCEEAATVAPVAQSAAAVSAGAPSTCGRSVLQDAVSLTPLDSTEDRVQPFPRSPQLQRKLAKAASPAQEQLSQTLEELREEKTKTEARIQSLKKRRADLATRTDVMKQQIHARFEAMRAVLKQDEQAAMESLDIDLKRTRAMLDQVLKTWNQHLDQVSKTISSTQKALKDKTTPGGQKEGKKDTISLKKSDGAEKNIRLDEERFEKLLEMLSSICKELKAQLQRKTLLLDLLPVVVDAQTCHPQLTVTSDGQGLVYGAACSSLERPLQFDRVCCALGSAPLCSGQGYWEVDVRCCSGWAVGVAYGRLERKGRDKGSKLGRNRNSWCVEFRNEKLSAWHNDRHVACHWVGLGRVRVRRVGVWVHFDKGQLVFYDAETMGVLQSFSAAMTTVFDRVHHQFTEPLYPAVRFVKPNRQTWPNHIEFCHSPFTL